MNTFYDLAWSYWFLPLNSLTTSSFVSFHCMHVYMMEYILRACVRACVRAYVSVCLFVLRFVQLLLLLVTGPFMNSQIWERVIDYFGNPLF